MGAPLSLMSGALSLEKLVKNALTSRVHELGEHKDDLDQFHMQILDIFAKINSSMPGVRYDVPSRDKIQDLLGKWTNASDEDKLRLLSELFKQMNPVSSTTIVTGIVAPPAAMMLKRAMEKAPKIKKVRYVPDEVFVPATTLASLALARFCTKILQG